MEHDSQRDGLHGIGHHGEMKLVEPSKVRDMACAIIGLASEKEANLIELQIAINSAKAAVDAELEKRYAELAEQSSC